MKNDDNSSNLVTTWAVESTSVNEEFDDYSHALYIFNKISNDGTQVILYELKRNRSDGSTVKKTPLLNSKNVGPKPSSIRNIISSKSKEKLISHIINNDIFKGYKARILLLVIVLIAFIAIVFFFNSLGGKSQDVTTIHDFILFSIGKSSPLL